MALCISAARSASACSDSAVVMGAVSESAGSPSGVEVDVVDPLLPLAD